jgi:prepilin-type N-terminal cleavage/methylation domain-containing protein
VKRLAGQAGMTLVELVVAMAMLSIVLLIFTSVLASVQRTVVVNQRYSEANDQARLALQQLDRELRSGNVITDPADAISGFTGAPAYQRLLIYTQANLPTRGEAQCEIWKITSDHELQVRRWIPGASDWETSWVTVAESVVNRSTSVNAFTMNTDPLKGERTVDIHLQVNPDLDANPGRTIDIKASLTGRNTSYNYPTNICLTLPSAA